MDFRNRLVVMLLRALALAWLCAFCAAAALAAPPRLNTLYHFVAQDYPHTGNFELSRLVQASDGDFYGVSAYGGVNDFGFVYKVSRSTGQLTHLHDFAFPDGATPRGQLVQAADGWLYGTTESGGANFSDWCYAGKFYNEAGCGTLFRISTGGSFQKLHDFYSEADGYQATPARGVVQAPDGNFYGMAMRPFPDATTSLFRMTPGGTVSVHHLFALDESEGYLAWAGLIVGADGALYGTTSSAGTVGGNPTAGCGTVFRAGVDGSFALLHVFGGPNVGGDGCFPTAPLVQARDGNFYGTTQFGGTATHHCIAGGCGIVFKLTPAGVETVLHRFAASALDGEYPQDDGLVQTPDGAFWGATGGNPYGDGAGFVPLCYVGSGTTFSCGTLYRIAPSGVFAQVAVFGNSDGAWGLFPHATPILASDGNLYGTTFAGGGWGYGTVYRLLLNAATPVVAIDGFTPPGGAPGTQITVSGSGFTGASQLTVGDGSQALPVPFTPISDTQLSFVVPATAQTSAVGLTTPRGTTFSPMWFYLPPRIDAIVPTTGRPGTPVTLYGAHFDDLSAIVFGGGAKASRYSYPNGGDTQVRVTIPALAQTGPVTVSNPGGSGQSPVLTVNRLAGAEAPAADSEAGASDASAPAGVSCPRAARTGACGAPAALGRR